MYQSQNYYMISWGIVYHRLWTTMSFRSSLYYHSLC